jgi:hypothetical protein
MCWIARALGYDAHPRKGSVLMSRNPDTWGVHCWCELNEDVEAHIIDCERHRNTGLDFYWKTYNNAPAYYRLEA